jgi:hypothetical protein
MIVSCSRAFGVQNFVLHWVGMRQAAMIAAFRRLKAVA